MDNDETSAFLAEIENRRGGKIAWRTYSTWFANSKGTIREYGVFLYLVNDVLYYEDFKRTNQFLGITIKPRKNDPPYVKMEGSFLASDVVEIVKVTKKKALGYALGNYPLEKVRPAGAFNQFFSQIVSKVSLKDGSVLFLELIDGKEFAKMINNLNRK